jgi:hypothetical protein
VLGTLSPEHALSGITWKCRGAVNHPYGNYLWIEAQAPVFRLG